MGWVSLFDPQRLAALLAMPADAEPVAILCLGPVPEFPDRPALELDGWTFARPLVGVRLRKPLGSAAAALGPASPRRGRRGNGQHGAVPLGVMQSSRCGPGQCAATTNSVRAVVAAEHAGERAAIELDPLQHLAALRAPARSSDRATSAYQAAPSRSRQMPSGECARPASAHTRRFDSDPSAPMSKAVSRCRYDSATISVASSAVIAIPLGNARSSATTRALPVRRATRATNPGAGIAGGRARGEVEVDVVDVDVAAAVDHDVVGAVRRQRRQVGIVAPACRPPTAEATPACRTRRQHQALAGGCPAGSRNTLATTRCSSTIRSTSPAGSMARISPAVQSATHNRPSRQRGDFQQSQTGHHRVHSAFPSPRASSGSLLSDCGTLRLIASSCGIVAGRKAT